MSKGKEFISQLKLYTDYLKWDEEKQKYETWEEACEKVLDTHRLKYGEKVNKYIQEVLPSYKNKEFLSSQRNLQFRGDLILKNNCKLYNCCVSYAYSPDVFSKGFFILLSGTGLGISMKNKFIKQLPTINRRDQGVKMFSIPDSIEGWAEAAKVLISSYCKHPSLYEEYYKYQVKFDYSQIRPKGAMITGGFKAPGHEGLKQSLERIEDLLNNYLGEDTNKVFKSIIAYDIFMHLSDAVLSGGVRRSAMNIIIDEDDEELLNAKTGNWRQTHPWRARSNNSVGLLRHTFTKNYFDKLVSLNEGDNDLGFVFMSDEDDMFNPCVSEDSLINTPDGLYFPTSLMKNNSVTISGINFNSKPFRKTGFLPTLEIKTNSGRKVKVTPNHLMLLGNEQTYVSADSLKKGDTLTISNNEVRNVNLDFSSLDFKKGYLLGSFLGDGNFSKESCQIKFWGKNNSKYHNKCLDFIKDLGWDFPKGNNHKYLEKDKENYTVLNIKKLYNFIYEKDSSVLQDKKLSKKLLEGSFDYISGIISGYFDADGTVLKNKNKGNSIRIVSNNLENLENLQIGLNSLGVYSKIYNDRNRWNKGISKLPDGKGGVKEYKVKSTNELIISKKGISNFSLKTNILNEEKTGRINDIVNSYKRPFYRTNYIETIVDIKTVEAGYVYDCEVQTGVESFDCNGVIVHNCFEISFNFYKMIKNLNEAVFQFCNLNEISASACSHKNGTFSKEKFFDICRKSAIVGTLQAGYTSFPYLGKQTEDIVAGEALLGVSITGWMTRPELFNEEILKEGARIVKETNREVADIIGINYAARTTTVKPSGNASVILKTASGIHPEHSKRYFRIMQLNKDSDTAKYLLDNCPEVLEESVWSSTKTDYVVYSPCENPEGTLYKEEMQGVKHLKLIELVQNSWVKEGQTAELCYNPTAMHNVSNTVIIDNKDEIVDYIFEHQDNFTAVSFLSLFGDKDYAQAPFTSVLNTNELIEKYGDGVIFMSGLVVDGLHYFNNDLWTATTHVLNSDLPIVGSREQALLKKDWIRRVKQFSKNYFKGDLNKTIYCMKDVHLWHKWNTINRNFKLIDYPSILKKPEFVSVDTLGAIACSGGGCEITFR